VTSQNAALHAALRYSLGECKKSVTSTVSRGMLDAACPPRDRLSKQRGTGVTNAAALRPPQLHLFGFGVARMDGGLQPRPVQLTCSV